MTGSIFMYVFLDDAVLLLEAVNSAAKMFTLSFLDDEGFFNWLCHPDVPDLIYMNLKIQIFKFIFAKA